MAMAAGSFICSGSLMADRMSILTAAHCVSSGAGTADPTSTAAHFHGGMNPDHLMLGTGSTTVTDHFVNGVAANDAACNMTEGSDSGGASFLDGKVASVTSFKIRFGTGSGDIDTRLNSSFGELGGYASTASHADWINSVMLPVPEPRGWALMLAGFSMTGTRCAAAAAAAAHGSSSPDRLNRGAGRQRIGGRPTCVPPTLVGLARAGQWRAS